MKLHSRSLYVLIVLVIVSLGLASLWLIPGISAAPVAQDAHPVTLYFFWGEGCPHCAEAKPFLQDLTQRHSTVELESFEIYNNPQNQAYFNAMAAARGFEPRYVPTIFIGDAYWEGFADAMRAEIESAVQTCVRSGCPDPGADIVQGHKEVIPIPTPTETCGPDICVIPGTETSGDDRNPFITSEPSPTNSVTTTVSIYLFWGAGCPQCGTTKSHLEMASDLPQLGSDSGTETLTFLRSLAEGDEDVHLHAYDVWGVTTHIARFERLAETFNIEPHGVPTVFIGDRVWEGFDDEAAAEIEAYVQHCQEAGCPDPGARPPQPAPSPTTTTQPPTKAPTPASGEETLTVPVLGEISLGERSLWGSTVLIGLADGFTPCSLWGLSTLVALMLSTGTRKRALIIGLLYITVTAGIVVPFVVGLFTPLALASFPSWSRGAVSLLALFFAVLNIKDYVGHRTTPSVTIPDEKKPGIHQWMRQVINAGDSFGARVGATVALGVGVSLVAFACADAFPVVWTHHVASQDVRAITFALLLLLYIAIYQMDTLIVFGVSVLALKGARMEEKHSRMLKLIGGTLMLTLAAVVLIKPSLMNELDTTLLVFGTAGAAILVVWVLPRLGITIGTESQTEAPRPGQR